MGGLQRPVRLSSETRRFARESLDHKYGLDTRKTPSVSLDGIAGIDTLSQIEKYNIAIEKIAAEAPIRICDGELISGAATLGTAILHRVPATIDGNPLFNSVSHLTIDFETVLKYGISYIRQNVESSLARTSDGDKREVLNSCIRCIDAFNVWHGRYIEALEGMEGYSDNLRNLEKVPMKPAESFYEAVQSLWFAFAFVRLCGNWPGIGRIDYLLGDYLEKDLDSGAITIDRAREILAHFFIKGCEWVSGGVYGSGDAQHYQNIVLGGVGADGKEVTNKVTYLVFDILEELGISDFPTTVRLNKNTDEGLLRRVAEVMRYGGGILAVYNEDVIIDAFVARGYDLSEARTFANDGCWEVQIPGKTFFNYIPFDSLYVLQSETLKDYDGSASYSDFEELYRRYVENMRGAVEKIYSSVERKFVSTDLPVSEMSWNKTYPCTVVSLFEQGCIEKGLSYLEGGPIYNVISPHIGGMADTVNSLYAIKKLVYDEKKLTLSEFTDVLKNNWEGNDSLRKYALNKYSYYGNDNDEVDAIAVKLLSDFSDICDSLNGRCGYSFPAGASTFGRQLEWSSKRLASAHGRRAGEVLAANSSPTPGSDKEGATAMIKSYCKADHTRMSCGSALDVKLLPTSLSGEAGIEALVSLMRGFVTLGGFFMQPDVVDASILKEAQKDPDSYQTLSVRISGWNARFVTLNKQWQDMVIAQNGG